MKSPCYYCIGSDAYSCISHVHMHMYASYTLLTCPQHGLFALHRASSNGQTEVVRMLLDHGADVLAVDKVYVQGSQLNTACYFLTHIRGSRTGLADPVTTGPIFFAKLPISPCQNACRVQEG